jgi:hypothetical protein
MNNRFLLKTKWIVISVHQVISVTILIVFPLTKVLTPSIPSPPRRMNYQWSRGVQLITLKNRFESNKVS